MHKNKLAFWAFFAVYFVAIFFLWDTPVVYPVKIFVVFLHELSHGLAALVTGGEIVKIGLFSNEGGVAWTRGGNRFITLSAGYLGSLVFGGAIFLAAARTRADKVLSAVVGVLTIVITLFYVRNAFGIAFGIAFGLAMIAAAKWLKEAYNDVLLKVIGLTSCLYAILDIKSDILDRTVRSDAVMLQEITGIPSKVWGVLWIAIALAATAAFVWWGSKGESKTAAKV